uniref:Uncharacterized protein n=2 Tax=Arundo donax TaxID=35708 RepID=A0A0A9GA67_ARUDO
MLIFLDGGSSTFVLSGNTRQNRQIRGPNKMYLLDMISFNTEINTCIN